MINNQTMYAALSVIPLIRGLAFKLQASLALFSLLGSNNIMSELIVVPPLRTLGGQNCAHERELIVDTRGAVLRIPKPAKEPNKELFEFTTKHSSSDA